MINFYNLIHRSLIYNIQKELIVWPENNIYVGYKGNELLNKINNFRQRFAESGLEPGQKVIPAIPTNINTLCTLLAIQASGMIPVSPPSNLNFLSFILFLKKNKIRALIFNRKKSITQILLLKYLGVKIIFESEINHLFQSEIIEAQPHQAALISFSSGSTGKPKAIYRSHRVLTHQHLVIKNAFPPFEGQIDFPLFPNVLLHNLIVGVKSVLPNIENLKIENLKSDLILQEIKNSGINSMTGNVFYFSKLVGYLKANPDFFPQIKAIGIGGSPVHEPLVHSIKHFFNQATVYIIYGSSEAEPIAVRKVEDDLQNPLNGFYVGKIIPEIEIRILGNQKIETSFGLIKSGEIEVKGKHVASLDNNWLKTGDFGYLNVQNDLYLTGRIGNEKAHFALQHYQIENLLLQQNKIKKVAAIAKLNRFELFVEGNIKESEIWEIVKNNLPIGSISAIHLDKKIPLDIRHHSKIIYEKLK